MFSRKSTFRSGPPKIMKSSGGDEEAAVVVIVLLMYCVFVTFAGFWYTSRGKKGDSCKKSDETTEYQLDDKLKCKFVKCKIGYTKDSTDLCVVDQSGQVCQGTDINATYTTDVSNICTFASCNTGYELSDDGITCVVVPAGAGGGGGGGGGGSTNCVATPNTWGTCSATCGGGTQSRGYTTTTVESNGGLCPERTKTDEQACNPQACTGGLTSYVPTSETPTTNTTPTVLTGGELTTVSTVVTRPTTSPTENVGSYTTATATTVDTTAYELRDKSTFPTGTQNLITKYEALGPYNKRCLGNDFDLNQYCRKTTGNAFQNVSPNLYANYDNPWDDAIRKRTIAQHWVANAAGIDCRDLFDYELDQHKQPEGFDDENIEVYRVSAAKMYKDDMPGALINGERYCPPLYYKVVE